MTQRIWALCPFSRPERLHTVLDEFRAQTYGNKGLVLIENKGALGACAAAGVTPDLLLRSDPHQSWAKNAGLAELDPDDWFVTWDDDDHRGPGALEEVAQAAAPGVVLGKASFFMRLNDGRLIRFRRPEGMLWGGTLAARVGDAVPFEETGRWGEDEHWLARMRALGMRTQSLSEWHFVCNRNGGPHAWAASDELVRNSLLGDRPDVIAEDFGAAPDSAVDCGNLPPARLLDARAFDWDLAYNELETAANDEAEFR